MACKRKDPDDTVVCIICFEPATTFWIPEHPCGCKTPVHDHCWIQWVRFGNGVCLICRDYTDRVVQRQYRPTGTFYVLYFLYFLLFICSCIFIISFTMRFFPDELDRLLLHDEL